MNKYQVEVYVTHTVWVWGENEAEAHEKAESLVFEEKINHRNGDLITGYKVTPLRTDSEHNFI